MADIPYEDDILEGKWEQSWFSRVLKPHKSEISEIREAYKLILAIVELVQQNFPSIDPQLDRNYIDLFTLAEINKKKIEDDIFDHYDANANQGAGLPADYIHTDIFSDFYKPFNTLYEVQPLTSWNDVFQQMHTSYSQIENAYHIQTADKEKNLPNQKFFNSVKNYLSTLPRKQTEKLTCGDLVLDLKRGTIQYETNPSKDISLDNQEVKLLIMLLKNKGDVVEYKTIAEQLQLNFYHKEITNKDAGEDMRYLKRDLRTLLKSIGMSDEDFRSFITAQKNVGYKLNCD